MCCCTASRRRRSGAATSSSRSLLSLARALTPPLEDRTITIPRSDDYESDDEHDIEMNDGDDDGENGENNHQLTNVTLSNANTSATPTFTSTSTSSTYTISSSSSTNAASEAQLNALYHALQVATTIGGVNGNGDANITTTTAAAASAVHVSSLLVQIGTLHLENDQVEVAASSFQSAINILERTGHDANIGSSGTVPEDNIRICVETTALKSLGHIFFKKCHYQQAMSYFLRAHSKNNKNGSSKADVLSDINILLAVACKHKASNEFRLSLDALLAASVGIEVAYGRFHGLFVNVLVEAASIFQCIGEANAATSLSRQVLIISQQIQQQQQQQRGELEDPVVVHQCEPNSLSPIVGQSV